MNLLAISEVAGNGKRVNATVQYTEDGYKHRYRAEVHVSGTTMAHSFHHFRDKAIRWAERMHAAYMQSHRAI